MTIATETQTHSRIVPNDATERAMYQRADVGPNGACATLYGAGINGSRFNVTCTTSNQAAALEGLFRVIRTRLEEIERETMTRGPGPAVAKG